MQSKVVSLKMTDCLIKEALRSVQNIDEFSEKDK